MAALTGGSLFRLLWLNPHLWVASLRAQPAGLEWATAKRQELKPRKGLQRAGHI